MNRCNKPSQDTLSPLDDVFHSPDSPFYNTRQITQATAVIDLNAIKHNARVLRAFAPEHQLLLALKANAYGHGLVAVARAVADEANYLAVARLAEALELRGANIKTPIVVLSDAVSSDNINHFRDSSLTPCLYSGKTIVEQLNLLSENPIDYWLKLNTGMNRLGLDVSDIDKRANLFRNAPQPSVVLTHFSDSENIDSSKTREQINAFKKALAILQSDHRLEVNSIGISLNNSAAAIRNLNLELDNRQINRCGIALYGAAHSEEKLDEQLKPAMALYAPIIDVHQLKTGDQVGYNGIWQAEKDSLIATVAIGYGDGYPRHANNGTPVRVNNQRAKLVGRVSMDMISIDITDIDNSHLLQPGDSVCLWGDGLSVETVAKHADTISYDLLTGISDRIKRVYLE